MLWPVEQRLLWMDFVEHGTYYQRVNLSKLGDVTRVAGPSRGGHTPRVVHMDAYAIICNKCICANYGIINFK